MRILLIIPAGEQYRVSHPSDRVLPRKMLRFSILPLTQLAALTPPEDEVIICDENVQPLPIDEHFDLVGLSLMTAVAPRGYEIAAVFRARGIPTIAGGFHATFRPDEVRQHVDAVVIGEAEGAWQRALADLRAGCLQACYQNDGPVDMATVPAPRRELMGPQRRHYVTVNAVQAGRGCQHACQYCSVTAFHRHRYRHRPLDHVVEELRGLPRDVMFVDDNIIADPAFCRALFTAMIPLKKRWVSQCAIELADDPELLALARRAGCVGLFIGIETLQVRNLAQMDKDFNAEHSYAERIARIHGARIAVLAGLIVGLDDDDVTVFRTLLECMQTLEIQTIQLNILTPLPGTPLFDTFQRSGRLRDHDWTHYDFRHTVIQPAKMTPEQLQAGADWLYAQFYRPDRMLWRTLRTWWRLGGLQAWLTGGLNLTYWRDNRREHIVGYDPAEEHSIPGVPLPGMYRR